MNSSVDDLFQQWLAAFEAGRPVSVASLCGSETELERQLSNLIGRWRKLNQTWHTEQIEPSAEAQPDDSALTGTDQVDLKTGYGDLEHLATGGIGVVYRATDTSLDRSVAIKTQRSLNQKQDASDRFAIEARITASLDHPGVVPVYAMGQTRQGEPFYVMRMVQGQTMGDAIEAFHKAHERLDQKALFSREFHDLLARLATVCKTIAYAHSRGIIHCDLKPRNVLFGKYGETIVLDWGSAMPVGRNDQDRTDGEETIEFVSSTNSESTPNQVSGTLPYMSPEHAAGSTQLTRQSDVFSLGVSLYVALVGRTPYSGNSTHEIRKQIIRGDFQTPRKIAPKVSTAIEAICLKAMAGEPSQRYQSAMDLAVDIERFLADETIPGIREPIASKMARVVRQHRHATLMAMFGIGATLLMALGFFFWQSRMAARENRAHRNGLKIQAVLAADSIRYELDRRIWALETAARSPKLNQYLKRHEDSEATNEESFNELLAAMAQPYVNQLESYCWFVNANDGQGTQVARFPSRDDNGKTFSSLGGSYARREYFNGQANVPVAANLSTLSPILDPHITTPFRGTHGEFVVAISTPIHDLEDTDKQLGVIGMAVRVGDITAVGRAVSDGDFLVIGHLGTDFVAGKSGSRGLIMQHPAFASLQHESLHSLVPRFSGTTLNHFDNKSSAGFSQGWILPTGYRDPIGETVPKYSDRWLASAAFVNPPSRLQANQKLNWIVILQEK